MSYLNKVKLRKDDHFINSQKYPDNAGVAVHCTRHHVVVGASSFRAKKELFFG